MALTISKLKMWKDPKYTRGSIEIPPAGSKKLPASPDYTLAAGETLRPHKGSTLTSLQLPLSFTELFDMSYLYIEASDGKGSISLFGWIESVTQIASSAEAVQIDWTVDWWRSYSGSMTFGRALITRCGNATYKRPYSVTPRYRTVSTVQNIETDITNHNTGWCILKVADRTYDNTTLSWETHGLKTYFFPFRLSGGYWVIHQANIPGGVDMDSTQAPSGDDIYNGNVATKLGIVSEAIVGAWFSPVAPISTAFYLYENGQIFAHYQVVKLYKNGAYGVYEYDSAQSGITDLIDFKKSYSINASGTATDDDVIYSVTDCSGQVVGSAPYGMMFKNMIVYFDVGATTGNLKVTLTPQTTYDWGDIAEGKTFTIPLPPLPISSNAWSDYVYSGQRLYEYNARVQQNNQQALEGVAGIATGALGGMIGGAMIGSAGGPVGAAGGAAIGALIGAIGLGATVVTNEINRQQMNDLEDQKHAEQFGRLTMPGDGFAFVQIKGIPKLITMTADTVSIAEHTADIANNGYEVQLPVASAASFVTAGGALRMNSLMITGNTPPQAKALVASMFESGVYIKENNPSGVAP